MFKGSAQLGSVMVSTNAQPFPTVEDLATKALTTLSLNAQGAPAEVQLQVSAFKEQLRKVLIHCMNEALQIERARPITKLN